MSLLGPQLEAFLSVVQYKTVHGAAEALYITQTAVTQRIRALETRLSSTLFIRTRRGMQLTLEGEALLHYCQAAKQLEGQTLAKIRGTDDTATTQIRLTGPTSIMSSRIIPHCIELTEQFPQLIFDFKITDTETRHKALKMGECDFAILQLEDISKEMKIKKLKPEKYLLVAPSKWHHRKLHDIISKERIIDFNPDDQMTLNYLKTYNLFDQIDILERHFVNHSETIATMVSAGLGYSVLTKEFSQPYVDRGELIVLNHSKMYENNVTLAWYDRHEPPPYFEAIIKNIE